MNFIGDSTSNIPTVPSTLNTGTNATIPNGRTAVLPNLTVQTGATLNIPTGATVFIPSGSGITKTSIGVNASDGITATINATSGMGTNQTFTLPTVGGTLATTGNFNNLTYKATPVSITAWAYSGTTTTTITLTVASHTFVVNDFILVNGLTTSTAVSTANNYIIPNGVYRVTAITGTTIQYTITTPSALTLTPTVSSAKVIGQTAINGVVPSAGVGSNQTWQDVTTSRALQTTYTNSIGNPIMVSVSKVNNVNTSWQFYINGVSIGYINGYGTNNSCVIIVPNGATYMADNVGGTLAKWTELR